MADPTRPLPTGETDVYYRVVTSTFHTPADLALAPRYARLESAVADMGEGIVVSESDGHIAAFHEKHLRFVEHALTRPTPTRSGEPNG